MNISRSVRYLWASMVIITASLLSACMPLQQAIPCEDVREDALRNLAFGVATMPEVQEWVSITHQADETFVTDQPNELGWSLGNRSQSARFEDGVLKRVVVSYFGRGPTVERVLECLGAPEYYEAAVKLDIKPQFVLDLWYPSQGFEAHSASFGRDSVDPQEVSKYRRMDRFSVTQPGALEDVVLAVYGRQVMEKYQDQIMSTIKPWPGSLDQITIDNQYQY